LYGRLEYIDIGAKHIYSSIDQLNRYYAKFRFFLIGLKSQSEIFHFGNIAPEFQQSSVYSPLNPPTLNHLSCYSLIYLSLREELYYRSLGLCVSQKIQFKLQHTNHLS